ncbi:DUF2934 domain-containing protein [Neorhizobium sp. T786]|nr:DUF2934 domain-containing protein [Neorhizobium xiangyangii]
MAENEEEWVRKRAYALWEEEGYPSGKHDDHWERARREFAAFGSSPAKRTPTPRTASSPSSKSSPPAAEPTASKPATKRIKKPTSGS